MTLLGLIVILLLGTVAYKPKVMSADTLDDLNRKRYGIKTELEAIDKDKKRLKKDLKYTKERFEIISQSLVETEKEMEGLEEKIKENKKSLKENEKNKKIFKESMKCKVRYLYENNSLDTFYSILLESHSFADFINRSYYFSRIAEHDKEMINNYGAMLTKIDKEKRKLETNKKKYKEEKKELQEEEDTFLEIIADVSSKYKGLKETKSEHAKRLQKVDKQIENMKKEEEMLAQLEREEEERIRRQNLNLEENYDYNYTPDYNQVEDDGYSEHIPYNNNKPLTLEEKYARQAEAEGRSGRKVTPKPGEEELLAAIIYCEAGGESYECQRCVGSVVLNRVNSSWFPNSITKVIYAKNQFSPVRSGRLATVLANSLITQSCRNAAREVLEGNIRGNWLYFRVHIGTHSGTLVGKTIFY